MVVYPVEASSRIVIASEAKKSIVGDSAAAPCIALSLRFSQ
jgi:hypothetical protein